MTQLILLLDKPPSHRFDLLAVLLVDPAVLLEAGIRNKTLDAFEDGKILVYQFGFVLVLGFVLVVDY